MLGSVLCVVGLGYIGLPTALLLAQSGVTVRGVDVSPQVVDSVNAGQLHLMEPHLAEVLQDALAKGRFCAQSTPEAADVFILAVPTPFTEGHKPDLRHIREAAESLVPVLRPGNLIILESTSPVGATELLADWLAKARPDLSFPQTAGDNADVQLAYCPERVLPGKILEELVSNDRIIGGLSAAASERASQVYRLFVKGEIAMTSARTAEMCKLTENSFRDVNIAFANELSVLCEALRIDVWELIRLANRHPRVSILQPGCGVGGHCIAVDPWFLVDQVPKEARLIRTAREVNDHKPFFVLNQVKEALADALAENPDQRMADMSVACLGLAFKPDIDDLRESPAVLLTEQIARLGCQVLAVEPHVPDLPPSLQKSRVKLVPLAEALKADVVCVQVRHSLFVEQAALILSSRHLVNPVGLALC